MTFTEAAIEVLRREGKPLHFKKIAEIAIRENLLDHVGKVPEETMADQLAAHCRQPRTERRVAAVQPGTFALVEWGLEEDPAGLEALVETPVEDDLLYRSRERHPVPSREIARNTGRGEGRGRRREEEERRGRRFPPPAEVAYEILAGAGRPLALVEIAAQGAERLLMPDAFVRDAASLQAALSEDNHRRESGGRKPLFQIEGETVTLVAQPEPGERVAPPAAARAPSSTAEIRRTALAGLRRRLRECDGPTVEHIAGKLLEKLGFRDLKVAKRGREHVVYTAKRRMGLTDVRHGIRIVRGGADAGRREVADLRRDLAHYGAQLGLVITAGEAAREARGEAGAAGQLPVVLVCGEAFAEALAEAGVGCVPVVVPEVDEAFFQAAAEIAEREESARRARREEREKREHRREPRLEPERAGEVSAQGSGSGDEAAVPSVEVSATREEPRPSSAASDEAGGPSGELEEDGEDEGDDEGPEVEAAEGAAPAEGAQPEGGPAGERRRRRRRRRRRGGRGRGREGSPGAPGAAAQGAQGQAGAPGGESGAPASRDEAPAPSEPPPPPPAPPGGGEGGSSS
ncbi:MAG TPA: HTH domain-containing protein [Anaeromyxobacter sp.]